MKHNQEIHQRLQGDLEAEHAANKAYQHGKWLQWAVEGGQQETPDAQAILGGGYDDRALSDVGLNGEVLAQKKNLLDGDKNIYDSMGRALRGRQTESDELRGQLAQRHKFYTSPVVREQARLLSKESVEVLDDPGNVLLYFTGKQIVDAHNDDLEGFETSDFSGNLGTVVTTKVPDGKRLVIDGIPKGSKYDDYPYTDEKPLDRIQVQIYHNPEGYLVADKVDASGLIGKKRPVNIQPTDDPRVVAIDQDAPEQRSMDSLWPSNDRKQEYVNPLDPNNRTIQLISTTSTWVAEQEGRYYQLEITVSTPDDGGNDVHLDFGNSSKPIPPDYGIITVRVVDDTTPEIAHQMYQ